MFCRGRPNSRIAQRQRDHRVTHRKLTPLRSGADLGSGHPQRSFCSGYVLKYKRAIESSMYFNPRQATYHGFSVVGHGSVSGGEAWSHNRCHGIAYA